MEFIILFILINFSIEYLTIPFTSTLSNIKDNLSPNEFMQNMYSNDLIIKIKIGTPYQDLNFFLDFNSYFTYILNSNLKEIKSIEKYNNSQSSTYKDYNNYTIFFESSSFDNGKNSSDILKLSNKINDIILKFILVTKSNAQTKLNFAGSFGLGAIDNGQIQFKENNLVYQFKKNNLTENYMFTLKFNKNDNNGKIIFGKNIYEKYLDDLFQYANIITLTSFKFIWGWDYFIVYFNNYLSNIKKIIITPDIGVCVANNELKNEIYHRYFNKLINDQKCFEGNIFNYYFFFYCNEETNLDFVYLNFTNPTKMKFELDYNDLIKVYNKKKYLLILFNHILPPKHIYIGLPLLKKYDLIFDQDKKIMGFYNFKIDNKDDYIDDDKKKDDNDDYIDEKEKKDDKETDNKKSKKKIYPDDENNINPKFYFVFLLFFLILIILYCVFIFYRRNRRKKNKLYQTDFEYEEFDKI